MEANMMVKHWKNHFNTQTRNLWFVFFKTDDWEEDKSNFELFYNLFCWFQCSNNFKTKNVFQFQKWFSWEDRFNFK